jgi:hypothetical protein
MEKEFIAATGADAAARMGHAEVETRRENRQKALILEANIPGSGIVSK